MKLVTICFSVSLLFDHCLSFALTVNKKARSPCMSTPGCQLGCFGLTHEAAPMEPALVVKAVNEWGPLVAVGLFTSYLHIC